MRKAGCLGALALALACSLGSTSARAETPDAEVAARLGFIEARLDAGTAAANRWSYGWLAAFGALTLGQYGVALGTTNAGFRADMAVGAVSSSLGVLPFGLVPFTPRFAAAELRVLPEGTPAERRRKLARAERLLAASAKREAGGRSWRAHVAGCGVAIAAGAVLAGAYGRVRSGILNGIVGVGVAEISIFTQPTAAIADWDAYSKGLWRGARRSGPSFGLTAVPGGIGIGGSF